MPPELRERLRIHTQGGLILYRAGLNNDGENGYVQDFSRDTLESGIAADDLDMIRDQIIYGHKLQARQKNPFTGAEPYKFHHQYPGVILANGLSTEYNASDTSALYLIAHAYYQDRTGDRSLIERFQEGIRGVVEVYIPSHINTETQQFIEDPKLCGATEFALKRTDWKDSMTPGREDGKVVYPVVYPNIQAIYMKALRDADLVLNTKEFTSEALKMRKGLQSLYDKEVGSLYIAIDKLGPISGINSDSLNIMAYLDLEDFEPAQLEAIIKASAVLETVAGYQNIDPRIARTMEDDYHARVWPKENAFIHKGATRLQQRAREEGLFVLVDAFEDVRRVSSRVYRYLDTYPETLKVEGKSVRKLGCDPQLWTYATKQYFERVFAIDSLAA